MSSKKAMKQAQKQNFARFKNNFSTNFKNNFKKKNFRMLIHLNKNNLKLKSIINKIL